MNDENSEEKVEQNQDITEEDILFYSIIPGPRIFTLNNAASTTMLAVLIEEKDDSFLVGLPSRLIEGEGNFKVEPFVPVPFMRLMKNSVLSVINLFGAFEEYYIPYLLEQGKELYPEIEDIIEDIREEYTDLEDITNSSSDGTHKTGMSDEALKEYLTEKFMEGGIAYGSGTKQ